MIAGIMGPSSAPSATGIAMSEPAVLDPAPTSPPRRRWLRRAVVAGLLLLAAVVGWGFYLNSVWDRELGEAIAEADRDDPDWHLMDIEAARPVLPDAENSSAQIARAKRAKPAKWLIWYFSPGTAGADVVLDDPEGFSRSLEEVPPQVRLDAEQERVLRSEMKRGAAAVAEARKIADLPRGRNPITWKPDYVSSLLPWSQESRDTVGFLRYDVMLRCQDGDLEGAIRSARASFNASRSLRDEPFLVSQLIRGATRRISLTDLERILAQGEPPPDALADFQRVLEEDEKDNLFLIAVRGDRGMIDAFLERVQNGEVSHAQMRQALATNSLYSGGEGLSMDLEVIALRGSARHERAETLRRMNCLVEIARLPPEERGREVRAWHASLNEGSPLQRKMLSPVLKVNEATRRSHAEMRCAIVLLALERFRQSRRQWPARLEDLTPAYLDAVPLDPFDGKPIKYARRDDGVTVYTVGRDGEDNGGNVSDNWQAQGTDWGFRLWDVNRRGQPAPPR
jgi:hypothetical protein